MHWRYAANAGFFGGRRDRFAQYRPDCSLDEKIRRVAGVRALTGIELKYPRDFESPGETTRLVADVGLVVSAINLDLKDPRWFSHGALSAPSRETRGRAISMGREALDLAAETGSGIVTTCPVMDGHDYALQREHVAAWDALCGSVSDIAAHRRDVSLLLEYQPRDPLAHIMLGNVGAVIETCLSIGSENLGVNLDVGHAFAAAENPAESAARLARHRLLRYIHSNDNPGDGGDWDMVSGSGHLFEWLDLVWTLRSVGYEGWMSGDIAPRFFDASRAFAANVAMIEALTDMAEELANRGVRPSPAGVPDLLEALASRIGGVRAEVER